MIRKLVCVPRLKLVAPFGKTPIALVVPSSKTMSTVAPASFMTKLTTPAPLVPLMLEAYGCAWATRPENKRAAKATNKASLRVKGSEGGVIMYFIEVFLVCRNCLTNEWELVSPIFSNHARWKKYRQRKAQCNHKISLLSKKSVSAPFA